MKALELAERFERNTHYIGQDKQTAAELRRLAEVNAELLSSLDDALSMSASRWLFHNDGLYKRASEFVAKAKEQQ